MITRLVRTPSDFETKRDVAVLKFLRAREELSKRRRRRRHREGEARPAKCNRRFFRFNVAVNDIPKGFSSMRLRIPGQRSRPPESICASAAAIRRNNDRPNFYGHVRKILFFFLSSRCFPSIPALRAVQGGEFKSIVVSRDRAKNKRSSNETLCTAANFRFPLKMFFCRGRP